MPWTPARRRLAAALAAVSLLAAPLVLSEYYLIVWSGALVLALAGLGVNLLLGYTGLLSLGHAAFFGIGAYAGAFLFTFAGVRSLEAHLAAGVLCATLLAAGLGVLCARSTRIYFSILTLAFGQMVYSLFVSGAVFRPFGVVGTHFFLIGNGGLYIPRFRMAGVAIGPERFTLAFYYVIAAAFLLGAALMARIVGSPFGKALTAIRDNELRAAFIGIPVRRYRWQVFVISAAFTALAGGLFGQLDRQVTPDQLHWLFSAQLVVAVVLGGMYHFAGPIAGALAVVALQEVALRFALYHSLLLGSMLVVVVRACPGGIAEAASRLLDRLGAGDGGARRGP